MKGPDLAVARTVLALDIGGTKVAAAHVRGGEVLSSEFLPTPATAGPEAVLAAAEQAASSVLATTSVQPITLGVACAGVVQAGEVHAMSPELLPGWHGFPLVAALEERLHLPVVAANDAQAAAYGEWRHGAGQGLQSIVFVTVSTGVGGGLVLNGRLWRGATGLAGHVGHMAGREVERLASGTALARRAAEAGRPGLGAREVIAAAAGGNGWAAQLVQDAASALARMFADVKLLVDPELVVMGGSVGLNEDFRGSVAAALAALPERLHIPVAPAGLGAMAGLVGAAALAVEELGHVPPT